MRSYGTSRRIGVFTENTLTTTTPIESSCVSYVDPPTYYETEMIPDKLAQQIKNTVRRLEELRKVANKYIDRKYDLA